MSEPRNRLKIFLIEPFWGGSHEAWARGLQRNSQHEITIIGQSAAHWKWRMHGGAITCSDRANSRAECPDLFLCSDMLDCAVFRSLLKPEWRTIPLAVYFHENQITYPFRTDMSPPERDRHYGFINYTTALAADSVLFNSGYHRDAFLEELPKFLKAFPDDRNEQTVSAIQRKSEVLPLGLDLKRFEPFFQTEQSQSPPLILWNHRHEHDKYPESFFRLLFRVEESGADYRLAVAGQSFRESPSVFEEAKQRLGHRIEHWGFCESFEEYARLLCRADILPVTSVQDFFGISVAEAIHCGVRALLPDRLAFPSLFAETATFYQYEEEAFAKLNLWLNSPPAARLPGRLSAMDWTAMAGVYDDVFDTITCGNSVD
jgi:glycosyltransferase involved in cell wall biosynthesis